MHFGDSHTAADSFSLAKFAEFQAEFGNGVRVSSSPQPDDNAASRVSAGQLGWIIEGIGGRVPADRILGPAGIALSTAATDERAWLQAPANHFEIYYVRQPGGGRVEISVDGLSVVDRPLTLNAPKPQFHSFRYDTPGTKLTRIEIRTVGEGEGKNPGHRR